MIRIRRDKVPGDTPAPRAPHARADADIAKLLHLLIGVRGEAEAALDIVRGLLSALGRRAPPFDDATAEEVAQFEAALKGLLRGAGGR
jgi:hypothetical protein